MIHVFLAGEGPNELGAFGKEESFQPASEKERRNSPGVLEALLRHVQADGWEVAGGIRWQNIRKLQVGVGKKGEEASVHRAFHHAKKRGCHVLAFTRDRDKPKYAHRVEEIETAIAALAATGDGPAIIGGVAIEKLESWLVAIAGIVGSEGMSRPEEVLSRLGIAEKDTEAMINLVTAADLSRIPADAKSLLLWLTRARAVLPARVKERAAE
ncbi:MAG: hypothetical protein ABI134_25640 [Byssovorax sp.]